jgi:3-methyl-2-oxobutanoate hydroxymethyltransferase
MRTTLPALRSLASERKLATLTCYDAAFAATLDAAGIDLLLVGDSLGMVVQGHDSTLPVSVADVAYHTAAVARGSRRCFLMADMPFGSYQQDPAQALSNAVLLMQAGAQMVKLEGGEEMAPTIRFLVERGVPVCGHVGLTPQHVNSFGGYRVQGRGGSGQLVRRAAQAVADAGAAMLVIEAVPEPLARVIAGESPAITIGIGASTACNGQVLVLHDLLGVGESKRPRFVRDFLADGGSVRGAAERYREQVIAGRFPGPDQVYPDSGQG